MNAWVKLLLQSGGFNFIILQLHTCPNIVSQQSFLSLSFSFKSLTYLVLASEQEYLRQIDY